MTIATPGDTVILSDDLAKRAAGDPALRDRASRRAVMKGGVQSMVGLDPSKLFIESGNSERLQTQRAG